MKLTSMALAAVAVCAFLVEPAAAQRAEQGMQRGQQDRGQQGRDQQHGRDRQDMRQQSQPNRDRGRNTQSQNRHYYNGQWVDFNEWQRHSSERDRWASQNRQRRGAHYESNGSSSLLSGIIGFALGAAIVGSQEQAQHAETADPSWDNQCAAKYRSYDRNSRTYLGYDGARHYCQ